MSKSIIFISNLTTDLQTERARYAAERLDFHSFFDLATVRDIQAVLRGEERDTLSPETRQEVLQTLFRAQRESPHRLWKLLILSAFETKLAKRRVLLSTFPDAELDELVVETFLDELDRLPDRDDPKVTTMCLFRAFGAALRARHAAAFGRVPEAPRSGVVCTVAESDGDDDGPESGVA